jgi:hypothetical protein
MILRTVTDIFNRCSSKICSIVHRQFEFILVPRQWSDHRRSRDVTHDSFFPCRSSPPVSQGLHTVEASRSHSVRLLWKSDKPVTETSTWPHTTLTTDIHTTERIRTRNPRKRAAADRSLRLRGHRDGIAVALVPNTWILVWSDNAESRLNTARNINSPGNVWSDVFFAILHTSPALRFFYHRLPTIAPLLHTNCHSGGHRRHHNAKYYCFPHISLNIRHKDLKFSLLNERRHREGDEVGLLSLT